MLLFFFQQLNYLVEQRALAFLATRVFLYRFAFSYKRKKKKKKVCCCINKKKKKKTTHRFVLCDEFWGVSFA